MSDYKGVHKDVAKLLKIAKKAGLDVQHEDGTNHIRVVNISTGGVAQVSKSPGSGKALTSFRSKLRRLGAPV